MHDPHVHWRHEASMHDPHVHWRHEASMHDPHVHWRHEASMHDGHVHWLDGYFPTALGRQTTFSDTSIWREFEASFKASFGGQMLFLKATCYDGLGKRRWELENSSAVVEIMPSYHD